MDEALWVEGKNGLEFKGFGSASGVPPRSSRLRDEDVAIHYEKDLRPLLPTVGHKPTQSAPSSSLEVTEARAAEDDASEHFKREVRHQAEEAFNVHEDVAGPRERESRADADLVRPFLGMPTASHELVAKSRPLRRVRLLARSPHLVAALTALIVGLTALATFFELHYVYEQDLGGVFVDGGWFISFRDVILDIRSWWGS